VRESKEAEMEFQEIVKRRYACKLFDGKPVPEETVRQLLEVIRWAPSGINLQPWKIRVVADSEMKRRLKAATFDEPQIESCSHLFVFCADADAAGARERLGREIEKAGVDEEHRKIMMFIAGELAALPREVYLGWAQNQVFIIACHAILAATDMGLESCPMTHFEPERYAQILNLPANLVPTILVPIGHGIDTPLPKWRYSLDEILVP
jgi:nitroreductase / dihydropteridine reductase